jgi:hypothetical protein
MTKITVPTDKLNGWCDDMSIAPTEGIIDILDGYNNRYVSCYHGKWGWYGKDANEYESVAERIHEPMYWMKVSLPYE